MILVHTVGIFVLIAGIILFARSQIRGSADPSTSQAQAWKINISGPPSLILVVIGLGVFLFPFTPWFGPPAESVVEVPVTTPIETTTAPSSETTEAAPLPVAPTDYEVFFDNSCEGDVIHWFTDPTPLGWYIQVDVFGPDDQYLSTFEFDSAETFFGGEFLCQWEFFWAEDSYYFLYVYSYDDVNYSADALTIAYP